MTQDWKTIVLMALNGSGVSEPEALMQIRVIEPMMEGYLKEERNAVLSEVEKEVEKRKQQEKEAKPAGEIEKIDERAYCAACDDISTIITNLRIKQ